MIRMSIGAACGALLAATSFLAGCSDSGRSQEATYASADLVPPRAEPSNALQRPAVTRPLRARDLVAELESAGLKAEEMGPAEISLDDLSRFPEEPRSTRRLRISDGNGNSAPIVFVEFDSWKAAAELDAKPVNGFAVRNWFMLGTVNNHFVNLIRAGLAG